MPDALHYGMQELFHKTEIPGTVAYLCMAVSTRKYGDDNDINTAKFGGIVAGLRHERVKR